MFGGKLMDTFVDKLANRFTAQEMIKANSAAETEELNQLRSQVAHYNDCLKQMEKLLAEMNETQQRIGEVLEDSTAEAMEALTAGGSNMLAQVAESSQGSIKALADSSQAQLKALAEDSRTQLQELITRNQSSMKQLADNSISKLEQLTANPVDMEQIKEVLDERANKSDESVHRECVKVYRNVQAVVNEESGKVSDALKEELHGQNGRMTAILSVSVMALLLSGAGVILQVLGILGLF